MSTASAICFLGYFNTAAFILWATHWGMVEGIAATIGALIVALRCDRCDRQEGRL